MDQSNFNFYEADNVYGALFFQFPKVLMYGDKYKTLSDTAKLAYMVLKDRLEYSLHNNWVDEAGRVYFIFTNQELIDIFNCSKGKVNKVKNELEECGLLFQKQMGFNPRTKKNEPNRLYLSKLEVQATDVYLKPQNNQKASETVDTSGSLKNGLPQETVKPVDTSGSSKNGLPHSTAENNAETVDTSGSLKNSHNLDYNPLDTTNDTNIDTINLDFSSSNFSKNDLEKQNKDIVNNATEFLVTNNNGATVPLEAETISLISLWSSGNPKLMKKMIGIIFSAKKTMEKEISEQTGKPLTIILDMEHELQHDITVTLRRTFNVIRNKQDNNKEVNPENYIYGAIKNAIAEWYNKVNANHDRAPQAY
ncbi:replication initiator protein A [Lactiplantibacillus mudanjiangensis]|uniref:Plasmid replication initiation protein (Plasmid) [Lactobacillus fermentum] n=1 Tax=Lactiplantibacillus mudanjiangensis TaxID=1296538 RepID=A0A660DZV1_9LACO|nr:replication initiator protein A [Lactiplantibacillus mudanjiangensis]VDG25039.1 plasmid replication initiation protein (plasmid) [Lactobacillus fermentum] [Lactiplantibacillus mudanjiangensis]VDG28945.1 plasmid replication initiation protein (plasmid) [Lactobacillus fermentum] [Lactiplantibacillus mudanjiangensis]